MPDDHGSRGIFDAQAWDFSPKLWAATHKLETADEALTVGIGIGAVLHNILSD